MEQESSPTPSRHRRPRCGRGVRRRPVIPRTPFSTRVRLGEAHRRLALGLGSPCGFRHAITQDVADSDIDGSIALIDKMRRSKGHLRARGTSVNCHGPRASQSNMAVALPCTTATPLARLQHLPSRGTRPARNLAVHPLRAREKCQSKPSYSRPGLAARRRTDSTRGSSKR